MDKLKKPSRYMDEIEAWNAASQWINAQTRLPDRVECYGLQKAHLDNLSGGGVKVVWDGPKLLGIITVIRDDHNFSVLSICEAS